MSATLRRWLRPAPLPCRRKDLSYRPSLEALEERWVPAVKTWTGAVDMDMRNSANWNGGRPEGQQDEAIFNDSAARDARLNVGDTLTVGKLTVAANFPMKMFVDGSLTLDMGAVAGDSTWADDGFLEVKTGGVFQIQGNRTLIFSNGGVISPLNAIGDVKVVQGATLKLTGSTSAFWPNLTVGDGTMAGAGTVEVGGLDADIDSGAGGNITVKANATFKMTRTGQSATSRGGLDSVNLMRLGTFYNEGTFLRDGNTGSDFYPKLGFLFVNQGTLRLTHTSNLEFSRKNDIGLSVVNYTGATFELNPGTFVKAEGRYLQHGGTFQTLGEAGSGAGSVFFYVESEFRGGALHVNKDGGIGTLDFGSNALVFKESIVIYLDLDGTGPGGQGGDQISAGTVTIDNSGTQKPGLHLKTHTAVPPQGWGFLIIFATSLTGTFDAARITYEGFTPDGGYLIDYLDSPPRVRVRRP